MKKAIKEEKNRNKEVVESNTQDNKDEIVEVAQTPQEMKKMKFQDVQQETTSGLIH